MENLLPLNQDRRECPSHLLEVLDESSLGHVNSQLTYVGHVIANPLQMLGHKKQPRVTGCSGGFSHHHLNQLVKNVVVEFIDLGVAQNHLAGRGRITGRESIKRSSEPTQPVTC